MNLWMEWCSYSFFVLSMSKMSRSSLRLAADLGLDLADFGLGDSGVSCDIRTCDFLNTDKTISKISSIHVWALEQINIKNSNNILQ